LTDETPTADPPSGTVQKRRSAPVKRALVLLFTILILIVTGSAVWLWFGAPGGVGLAAQVLNERQIGRFGQLELQGVRETSSGATVEHLTLSDTKGVWLKASNIAVDWQPRALFARRLELESLAAARVEIVRRPILRPPGPRRPLPIDIQIRKLDTALSLRSGALNNQEALNLSVNGQIALARNQSVKINLKAASIAGPREQIALNLIQSRQRAFDIDVSGIGNKGGLIAIIFGNPDAAQTRLLIRGRGDANAGSAQFRLNSDAQNEGDIQANWTRDGGKLTGFLGPDSRSLLGTQLSRFGPVLNLEAAFQAIRSGKRSTTASIKSTALAIMFEGQTDFEKARIEPGARVEVARADLALLSNNRIAGQASGIFSIAGEISPRTGRAQGEVTLTNLQAFGVGVDRVVSPISIEATPRTIEVTANVQNQKLSARDPRLAQLGSNAKLDLALSQNRQTHVWTLVRGKLTGRDLSADLRGQFGRDLRALKGKANLGNLAAISPLLSGGANLDVDLRQRDGVPWQGSARLSGQRLTSPNQSLAQLIGNRLELLVTPATGSAGNAFAWQLKTGAGQAQGTVNLDQTLPLRGRWALQTAFNIARVTISNARQGGAAGELAFGPAGLALSSENARIAIGGWTLDNTRALIVGGFKGRPFQASLSGIAPLGPADLTTQISTKDGQTSFSNIVVRHAGLLAQGAGQSKGREFNALFDVSLEAGSVLQSGTSSGKLGIAVRNGQVGVGADMDFREARFAGVPAQVMAGKLQARGLLGDLNLAFNGDVRVGTQAGTLNLKGNADIDGTQTSLVLNGSGLIGGRQFVLSQPLRAQPLGRQARVSGQATWGGYRFDLNGQVRGDGIDVRRFDLEGPNLSAQVSGRLAGSGSSLRGSARVTDLNRLDERLKGSAQGALTLTGTARTGFIAQVRGRANGLSLGNRDFDDLLGPQPRFELTARLPQGAGLVGEWKLFGQKLSGEGQVTPPRNGGFADLTGTWRVNGPARLGGLELEGDVVGDVALANRALTIMARSPRLEIAGQSWSEIGAEMTVADIFEARNFPFKAKAIGGLGPLAVSGELVPGNPARLQPLAINYAGIVGRGSLVLVPNGPSGNLTLSGNPAGVLTTGTASGFLTLASGSAGPQLDGRLSFSNASYAAAGISGLNGAFALTGPIKDLSARVNAQFDVRGERADANLLGKVAQSSGETRLTVTGNGSFQNAPWRLSEPLLLSTQSGTTRASGKAIWRSANLGLNAAFEPARLRLTATLENAPASLFNRNATRFDGMLNGSVSLTGQGDSFNGEGQLRATGLAPVSADRREALDGLITARLRNGNLSFEGNASNPSGLRATGQAQLSAITALAPFRLQIVRSAPLSGSFEVSGPVEALAKLALSRSSTASGTIMARGQLSGTVAAPSIQGRGEVSDAALRDPSIGISITQANAAINFLGPVGEIERFSASDGRGGRLQLGGRISFAQGANWRLVGDMTRFQIIGNNEATVVATGPWSLAFDRGQTVLGGVLSLDNARIGIPNVGSRTDALRVREINRPNSLPPLAPATSTDMPSAAGGGQDRRGRALGLDLKLTSRGTSRVLSRGLDAYFDLDVVVRGDTRQPEVSGTANLTQGRFDLAGRSFDMRRGSVRFQSPLSATRIDFQAERQASDITALAKIQGTLRRPVFTLESTPPLPQDEVLSRILFGRNVAALSLPQATQLALSVSSLATGTQFNPADRLGQALGLERLSLGTEGGGFSGITAGLRLVRDVYVEVTTGGQDGTVTMLEWRPRRRVQVQVTTNQNRESAVSVRLRSKD
jgi:autotransporter translocation and assembly factor TamB